MRSSGWRITSSGNGSATGATVPSIRTTDLTGGHIEEHRVVDDEAAWSDRIGLAQPAPRPGEDPRPAALPRSARVARGLPGPVVRIREANLVQVHGEEVHLHHPR